MSELETRFRSVTRKIVLPLGWDVTVRKHPELHYWFLQVGDPKGTDNVTGLPHAWRGRKWLLSEHMTDGEIVQTAFLALLTAFEHEARETFLYRGEPIFDPHYDVEKLVDLRRQPDALKERTSA